MKKGQDGVINVAWLIAIIALFLILYTVLLPEEDKVNLINNPGQLDRDIDDIRGGGPIYPGEPFGRGTLLLSETPGTLYPYAQHLFVKPLASVNLFSTVQKGEQQLASSLSLKSSLFSGDEQTYSFLVPNPNSVEKLQLLFVIQSARGDVEIAVNGQQLFSGKLSTTDLPITIPKSLLRKSNILTISVGASMLGGNAYALRDVSLFLSDREENVRELRDFVLSYNQLQNIQDLTLYYFVNCFTVNERGTLNIFLNGNLLSQQLVVCDAGEISQDLPLNYLIEGRNVLDFSITGGQFILEQLTIEGSTGQGRVPSYFFTLQVDDIAYGAPVGLDMKFYEDRLRKVGTVYLNGFPLYIDTYDNGLFFDVTPYVVQGQNVLKIIPETELDVIDLAVFLG